MGYSIYAIIPKHTDYTVKVLEREFTQGNNLFGKAYIDGTRELCTNGALAYTEKKHLKRGTLIGFNFTSPPTPIREYLNSVILMLILNFSEKKKFYYDGEEWDVVRTREEGRALSNDWIACDNDGVVIPYDTSTIGKFLKWTPSKKEFNLIRAEVRRLKRLCI